MTYTQLAAQLRLLASRLDDSRAYKQVFAVTVPITIK